MGHESKTSDADLLYNFHDIDAGLMASEDENLLRFADLVKNPEKHYPGGGIHFAVWYRKAVMDAHAVYRSMCSRSTARTPRQGEMPVNSNENKTSSISKTTVSDDKGTSDVKSEVDPPRNPLANGSVEK
ncbi:hypothetical protein AAVH_35591 [Aphelenchoides avenae]|nr:hypothetical protein AAVH_35591 [Aphelenchus avenae]